MNKRADHFQMAMNITCTSPVSVLTNIFSPGMDIFWHWHMIAVLLDVPIRKKYT